MGPRRRGARKRKTEEALEGEKGGEGIEEEEEEAGVRGDRRRKGRGNKKYIGAHVGIQGKA